MRKQLVLALSLFIVETSAAHAQDPTPGCNNVIPDTILTPDSVETSIGDLDLFDGLLDVDTVSKVYDNFDSLHATEVFLNMVRAAVSLEGMRPDLESLGIIQANQLMVFD